MEIAVYRNLNLSKRGKPPVWSIALIKGNDGRGKVIEHRGNVTIANVRFVVKDSRRQAIIRSGQREVYAWAIGELIDSAPADLPAIELTINPHDTAHDGFVTREGAPIQGADYVEFGAHAVARGAVR